MELLITGGSGYLGGRIIEYLTQKGYSVRVSGRDIFSDRKSLELACNGIKTIIHLAAMNAQDCAKDPEKALLVNGLNSLKLINAAENMGVSKFLYFSTAHVYNSPLVGKLSEENLPCPTHPYSITHRLAEDYVMEASARGKLSGIIFRLTNAVGSPVKQNTNCWMLVVNDLCKQVVVNKKMKLRSAETVRRDFLPISTVINATNYALQDNMLAQGIYNLSSGRTMTLRELTSLIADRSENILGFRPDVEFESDVITESSEKLEISNGKLISSGFKEKTNILDEIDQLLLNCNSWFSS
jgi:UDP-glucose 4-epimerase